MPKFSNLQALPGLTFASGSSDRVSFGSAAAWEGLTSLTILLLVQNGSGTANRLLLAKSASVSISGYKLLTSGTTGNLQFTGFYAGTSLSYITNDTPMAWGGLGQRWKWVAVAFDSVNAPMARIYTAKFGLGGPLRESTYGTAADGTGAYVVDTNGNNLLLGNDSGIGSGFNGTMSVFGFWSGVKSPLFLNRVITALEESPFEELPPAQIYGVLGAEGSGVLNRANPGSTNGTVTGTTRGPGPGARSRYVLTQFRTALTASAILQRVTLGMSKAGQRKVME